jgi:ribosomal protein S18 acetylase RimI-like enzyme
VVDPLAIRRATPADVRPIAALAAELVRLHHNANPNRFFLVDRVEDGYAHWFSRELERPEAVIVVASHGDSIEGYAYGALEDRDWNLLLDEHGAIHDVFVSPSARGHGLGSALVKALVAALEGLGAPRIILSTMVDNAAAQRVFRACGFRSTMLEMMRQAIP